MHCDIVFKALRYLYIILKILYSETQVAILEGESLIILDGESLIILDGESLIILKG